MLAATPTVIAAWVFGSAQGGEVGEGSDVDIGLLMESKPSFDEQLELWVSLQKAIRVAELDLVVLNEANPILRFEAISGRAIFCRDVGRRAEFASLTAREYEDSMALWQRGLVYREPISY
jgi:predicted nucleotidyltransferase